MKKWKRILILVLAAAMLFQMTAWADGVIPGDVNGDGRKNAADAVYLLRHTLFSSMYPVNQSADMNGDAAVTQADAIYLLRHILFPERYSLKQNLPACAHEEAVIPAVDATCVESGLTEGKRCTKCEAILLAQETVPALGHQYENGICLVCGEEELFSQGLVYTLSDDGSYYIVSGIGVCEDEKILIPDTYEELPVRAIGAYAFASSAISFVKIPEGVTKIGENAFSDCTVLKQISLPDTVTDVGSACFMGCSALEDVHLSAGMKEIANHLFAGCISLPQIVIPFGIMDIRNEAFLSCTSLAEVELPAHLLEISSQAFGHCAALATIFFGGTEMEWNVICKADSWDFGTGDYDMIFIGEEEPSEGLYYTLSEDGSYYIVSGMGTFRGAYIVIPEEHEGLPVKEIGEAAFLNQMYIGGVKMSDRIEKIGALAFSGCHRLSRIHFSAQLREIGAQAFSGTALPHLTLPFGLKNIGAYAFSQCASLQTVSLPNSVLSVGSYAFYGCSELSSITLSEKMSEIAEGLFLYCRNLSEIFLSANIKSIGARAFSFCDVLTITFDGTPTQWGFVSQGAAWSDHTDLLLVCTKEDTIAYPDSLDAYASDYAYRSLAALPNGAAMQLFYEGMDAIVKEFHTSDQSFSETSDGYLPALNYKQLALSLDEAGAVWAAYMMDHPLYYWLTNIIGYTSKSLYLKVDRAYYQAEDRQRYHAMIYQAVYEMALSVEGETSAYQLALAYHDRILAGMDYAYEADGRTPSKDISAHNILGFFEKGFGVCESYAKVFQLLLNYSDVENVYVVGTTAGGGHAWNMLKLDDGNWYWFDLTWDDVPSFGWGMIYSYFCVNNTDNVHFYHQDGDRILSPATFLEEHMPSPQMDSTIYFMYALPEISETSYEGNLRDIFTVDEMTYAVSGYRTVQFVHTEKSGFVEIPEKVSFDGVTYTVTSIGGILENGLYTRAFVAPYAEEVAIPKTVIYIWEYAFADGMVDITVDGENPRYYSENGILLERVSEDLRKEANASTFVGSVLEKHMICLEEES